MEHVKPPRQRYLERLNEAAEHNIPIFAIVRDLDGYVLSGAPWCFHIFRMLYLQRARVDINPAVRLVEINPKDPTKDFNVDSQGTFWHGPIPYGRE